jgi:uncharacterized protein (DUF1697 family)
MNIYIALLRGINVSGHNKIKMADLKQLFIAEGYSNVTTYIQSGNIIFESVETDTFKIENQLIEAIKFKYGFVIKILILTKKQLGSIFNSNPFLKDNDTIDITKLCVTVLNKTPYNDGISQIEALNNSSDDVFKIINKSIFLHCPNGFGSTKLTNNLFEKKLKVDATTRNWKTITKLVELSN